MKTKKKTTRKRTTAIATSPNGLKVLGVYKEINPCYNDNGHFIVRSDGAVVFAAWTTGVLSVLKKREVESGKANNRPNWTTKKLSRREAIKVIKRMSDWDRV